jgi:hypothetical protein
MSRWNTAPRTGVRSPISTTSEGETTALGGGGFSRDPKSELFTLAVSNLVSEKGTFHEGGAERDARFNALVHQVALDDVVWFAKFLVFLRNVANMRSASIVAAVEGARALLLAKRGGGRQLIETAVQRADEPGDALAYWVNTYGRTGHQVPKPIKRGLADAVVRLWNERSYAKWDGANSAYRFADVLQIIHPEPKAAWQEALFKHILAERYSDTEVVPDELLPVLRARRALLATPADSRRQVTAGQLSEAGMTWEAYSGWLGGEMDARAWETIIPSMGYMALLRNLRNFDKAGISRQVQREVEDKLTDPEQVARSRQFPLRFLSAYRATATADVVTAWGPAIEQALNLSVQNIPTLQGRTLIMVDLSQSMYDGKLSDSSDLTWADAASVFGAALALRTKSDLYTFGSASTEYPQAIRRIRVPDRGSILPLVRNMTEEVVHFPGYAPIKGMGGTDTPLALRSALALDTGGKPYDRIVILTDEQYQQYGSWRTAAHDVDTVLSAFPNPVYTWNLAGYRVAQTRGGQRKRHTFAGLTDGAFRLIPLIEAGEHQDWSALFAGAIGN